MLYKGNNKFKTLHKGSELVTRVFKGDELVYQDLDALYSFKFTIDTRKNQNGGSNANDKTFAFRFGGMYKDFGGFDPVSVDWGDGTTETINPPSPMPNQFNVDVSHVYDTAGEYQIKLLPTVFVNGSPRSGWLSGLDFNVTAGSSYATVKVLSFDKALPEGSFNVYLGTSRPSGSNVPRANYYPLKLGGMRNLTHAPSNLIANITLVPPATSTQKAQFSLGSYWGQYCGYNVQEANFDCDIVVILKSYTDKLDPNIMARVENYSQAFDSALAYTHIKSSIEGIFDNVRTTGATSVYRMFYQTFAYPKSVFSGFFIPDDLFANIDLSHCKGCSSTFNGTFLLVLTQTSVTIPDRLLPLDYSAATSVDGLFQDTFRGIPNATDVAIPEHIFDGLDLSSASDVHDLFNGTFAGWSKTTNPIPSNLFSNVTLKDAVLVTYSMFNSTFAGYSENTTPSTMTIPPNLFSPLGPLRTSSSASMFYGTFNNAFKRSTACTIPAGLFDFLDMTNAAGQSVASLFMNTFYYCGESSTIAEIPAGIFDFLNTSNCTTCYRSFYATFQGYGKNSTVLNIPSGLFAHLDMSLCNNTYQMFTDTFAYCGRESTVATIPADIFSTLDLSSSTNIGGIFYETFKEYGYKSTVGTIPANIFANISAPLATGTGGMFYGTFEDAMHESTVITIPSGIFSALDMTNVTYTGGQYSGMFRATFRGIGTKNPNLTIPSGLFSTVDVSNVADCSALFTSTFQDAFYAAPYGSVNPVSIPATLFQSVDTSSATKTINMFSSTFKGAAIAEIPQGLLGGITVPPALSDHMGMFNSMFANSTRQNTVYTAPTVLNDLFDGMSDFSWGNSSGNSNQSPLGMMFQNSSNTYSNPAQNKMIMLLTGSASTVLQHFNFTPSGPLWTFQNQKALTDYATLPANWR